MKSMKYVLTVACMVLLAGCFEINEDVDVKSDGSGIYAYHMDMSQLLLAMQSYLKDDSSMQMPSKNIDTTIFMKSLIDTSTVITAENKALMKDGTLHMKLDMEKKIFKTDIRIPFTSLANLQKLYNSMSNQTLGFSKLLKGIAGKHDSVGLDTPSPAGNDQGMPDMNQFNAIYDFISHDGLISRKLNAEKWKALQASPQFAQLKEAGKMGISVPYTLTISVPRPIKKVDNPLAKFFPDRKKILIQYNLIEVFDHPESFEYTIVY